MLRQRAPARHTGGTLPTLLSAQIRACASGLVYDGCKPLKRVKGIIQQAIIHLPARRARRDAYRDARHLAPGKTGADGGLQEGARPLGLGDRLR